MISLGYDVSGNIEVIRILRLIRQIYTDIGLDFWLITKFTDFDLE